MDARTVVTVIGIIALVIVAVLFVWYRRREPGGIDVDIEVPGVKAGIRAKSEEPALRPEQLMEDVEGGYQEMPTDSVGRQVQKKVKNGKQRMT